MSLHEHAMYIALRLHDRYGARPGGSPLAPPLQMADTAAIVDAACRQLADRVREGKRVHLPYLGELELIPSRHGSARTLVYRAAPDLLEPPTDPTPPTDRPDGLETPA